MRAYAVLLVLALAAPAAHADQYTLRVDGETYPLEYESDAEVLAMQIDHGTRSLLIAVETGGDSMFWIRLPSEIVSPGTDGFAVLVDQLETDYGRVDHASESGTGSALFIPLHAGAQEIEIIGASVIPEFYAAMLVAAVVSAAVLTVARSGGNAVQPA